MPKVVTIYGGKWYLNENGDCINQGNLIYNVFSKESNFNTKVLPNLIKRLEDSFEGAIA